MQTPYSLNVPVVDPGTITVDGVLDEPEWAAAGYLTFGPTGTAGSYDNEMAYGAGGNAADDDQPEQVYRFLHDGAGNVYVAMESDDESIQTDSSSPPAWFNISQSDGLGFFPIFIKGGVVGNQAYYPSITLTFWPDAGASTVITAGMGEFQGIPAGTVVAGTGGWDWSFQPGSNTVNSTTDTDTGSLTYGIEGVENDIEALDDDIETIEERVQRFITRTWDDFIQLEVKLGQASVLQDYITGQLETLTRNFGNSD